MKVISYLIYLIFWEVFVLGGFTYLVFFKDANPWWMLLAVVLSGAALSPETWSALYKEKK